MLRCLFWLLTEYGRYTYAMGFQSLLVVAAQLIAIWVRDPGTLRLLQGTIFFFGCPFLLFGLNYMGVFVCYTVENESNDY